MSNDLSQYHGRVGLTTSKHKIQKDIGSLLHNKSDDQYWKQKKINPVYTFPH